MWRWKVLLMIGALLAACSQTDPETAGGVTLGTAPGATTAYNFAHAVAVGGSGLVSAVWHDGDGTGSGSIWYARSLDSGANWEAARVLGEYRAAEGQVAVASAGGVVLVAWHDHAAATGIYVTRSDDLGASFSDPELAVEGDAAHPSIGMDGQHAVMAWGDHTDGDQAEVFAMGSADGGVSWGDQVRVSDVPYESWVPAVAVSGGIAYVAWVDYRDGNEEEYLARSDDGGRTWSAPRRLTVDTADSWAPSLLAEGDIVHLSWFDRRHAQATEVEVEGALDAAMRLVGLDPAPIPERDPAVYYLPAFRDRMAAKRALLQDALPGFAASGGDAGAVEKHLRSVEDLTRQWEAGWEVFYQRSDDGGITWRDPVRLTAGSEPSLRPSIARSSNGLIVAWFAGRSGGGFDILLRTLRDGSETWEGAQRISGAGDHHRPSVAAVGETAHVVWVDVEADRILYTGVAAP